MEGQSDKKPVKLTPKQLRILKKAEDAAAAANATLENNVANDIYGDAPLIQSTELTDKIWVDIKAIGLAQVRIDDNRGPQSTSYLVPLDVVMV